MDLSEIASEYRMKGTQPWGLVNHMEVSPPIQRPMTNELCPSDVVNTCVIHRNDGYRISSVGDSLTHNPTAVILLLGFWYLTVYYVGKTILHLARSLFWKPLGPF